MLTVLQNRVTPHGDLVFSDAPFAAFGNRGIVHRGQSIIRPYAHRNWIVCATDALGPPDTFMQSDHRYTELFFLDEVTALAAGHRPCFFCRRGARPTSSISGLR